MIAGTENKHEKSHSSRNFVQKKKLWALADSSLSPLNFEQVLTWKLCCKYKTTEIADEYRDAFKKKWLMCDRCTKHEFQIKP